MSNTIPLPEPDVSWQDGQDQYGYVTYDHAYSAEALHAHAAAVTAAKDAEIAGLREQASGQSLQVLEMTIEVNALRADIERYVQIASEQGEHIKVLEDALWAADLAFAEHGILAVHATRMQVRAALGDKAS
jgi:hypothetical protein